MRYLIAKVSKPNPMVNMFGAFGSGDKESSTLVLVGTAVYDTVEAAKAKVQDLENELNVKADTMWEAKADNERVKMDKAFDDGSVYEAEIYMLIPVESVLQISSLPKHRREKANG